LLGKAASDASTPVTQSRLLGNKDQENQRNNKVNELT